MTLPVQYIWLIPALPLLAALVGALTPRRGRALASGAAIAAMAGSTLLSCSALATALADGVLGPGPREDWRHLHPVDGRFECRTFGTRTIVIDFAHTPDALDTILTAIHQFMRPWYAWLKTSP